MGNTPSSSSAGSPSLTAAAAATTTDSSSSPAAALLLRSSILLSPPLATSNAASTSSSFAGTAPLTPTHLLSLTPSPMVAVRRYTDAELKVLARLLAVALALRDSEDAETTLFGGATTFMGGGATSRSRNDKQRTRSRSWAGTLLTRDPTTTDLDGDIGLAAPPPTMMDNDNDENGDGDDEDATSVAASLADPPSSGVGGVTRSSSFSVLPHHHQPITTAMAMPFLDAPMSPRQLPPPLSHLMIAHGWPASALVPFATLAWVLSPVLLPPPPPPPLAPHRRSMTTSATADNTFNVGMVSTAAASAPGTPSRRSARVSPLPGMSSSSPFSLPRLLSDTSSLASPAQPMLALAKELADRMTAFVGSETEVTPAVPGLSPLLPSLVPVRVDDLDSVVHVGLCTKQLVAVVPEAVAAMAAASVIQLCCNQLTSIPSTIAHLTHLTVLSVAKNLLTSLPAELGHLTSLVELDVSHNRLTVLPASLGQLRKLHVLRAHHNMLTLLPPNLGRCSALISLDVSHNRLRVLPAELARIKGLRKIRTRHNPLAVIDASETRSDVVNAVVREGWWAGLRERASLDDASSSSSADPSHQTDTTEVDDDMTDDGFASIDPWAVQPTHADDNDDTEDVAAGDPPTVPTLRALAARALANSSSVRVPLASLPPGLAAYLTSYIRCTFCGTPVFERPVVRGIKRPGPPPPAQAADAAPAPPPAATPMAAVLCKAHWTTDRQRVRAMMAAPASVTARDWDNEDTRAAGTAVREWRRARDAGNVAAALAANKTRAANKQSGVAALSPSVPPSSMMMMSTASMARSRRATAASDSAMALTPSPSVMGGLAAISHPASYADDITVVAADGDGDRVRVLHSLDEHPLIEDEEQEQQPTPLDDSIVDDLDAYLRRRPDMPATATVAVHAALRRLPPRSTSMPALLVSPPVLVTRAGLNAAVSVLEPQSVQSYSGSLGSSSPQQPPLVLVTNGNSSTTGLMRRMSAKRGGGASKSMPDLAGAAAAAAVADPAAIPALPETAAAEAAGDQQQQQQQQHGVGGGEPRSAVGRAMRSVLRMGSVRR